ncbi:MAG TPA: ABC-2 family transporter protein [Opitutaceae bacterium]|nr:ABC-2 family transporter protein [Opitutaceae bacterium]
MTSLRQYLRIWLASARYSMVRTMMFRFDFLMWSLVELFWMSVNVLLVQVIYKHTHEVAGWTEYQMLLLVGTSMLIQRLLMGFFWTNLFELGRNIRTGQLDFFIAQPGEPLFMVSTRKIDLDGLANVIPALAVIFYAMHRLGLHPGILGVGEYFLCVLCGLMINYGALLAIVSLTFWISSSQGVEGSYFTFFEFARLPREAFRGVYSMLFVYILPVVIVSNVPARALLGGLDWLHALWLFGSSVLWFSLSVFVFHRGLSRYTSASS